MTPTTTPQHRPNNPAKVEKSYAYEDIYSKAAKAAPATMQFILALVFTANRAAIAIDIA